MQSKNISFPIYVKCDKMYQSKACVQEFWYFVSGLDIQLEQSENDNPVCKKSDAGCEIPVIYHFSSQLIQTYSLVVNVSSREPELGDLGSIPAGC